MDVKLIRTALHEFSEREGVHEQARTASYKELINTVLSIRASCIPKEAQSTFDQLPINKLPRLLIDLNADPNALRDLNVCINTIEKHHQRDLSQLSFKIIHDTAVKVKELGKGQLPQLTSQNEISNDKTIEVKTPSNDGPSR